MSTEKLTYVPTTADKLVGFRGACAVVILCAAAAIASPAQTFKTLLNFNVTNGAWPYGSLVQGTDGKLFGTTAEGEELIP